MALTKRRISRLIELGDLLCTSFSLEEAYRVISREMPPLFPAGVYYRCDAAGNLLEAAASWGEAPGKTVFSADDCFAVRRNRPHLVTGAEGGLPCPHTDGEKDNRAAICVPMNVYGEWLGLIHIRFASPAGEMASLTSRELGANEQLALLAARQISLSLRNLQFREQLSSQSMADPLTGLINRRYLEEVLARELKKALRESKPVGVVFMDIDRLGQINQTYGIETGEAIIKDLGRFLGGHIGGNEMACRWGADEFVLILPGASLTAARRRAENLREILKDHAARDDHKQMRRVTLSIGVAAMPDHGETAGDLLQSAKTAVKEAKKEGRDRVRIAD